MVKLFTYNRVMYGDYIRCIHCVRKCFQQHLTGHLVYHPKVWEMLLLILSLELGEIFRCSVNPAHKKSWRSFRGRFEIEVDVIISLYVIGLILLCTFHALNVMFLCSFIKI